MVFLDSGFYSCWFRRLLIFLNDSCILETDDLFIFIFIFLRPQRLVKFLLLNPLRDEDSER